jgi:hypothetical protein
MAGYFDEKTIAGFGAAGDLAGIGLSLFGASESSKGAQAKYDAQKKIAGLEIQADAQRRQAMEISARRNMLQTVRNAQQAQAQALANATSQGAQFSSGLAGGKGTVSGEAGTQMLGVSQNLQIGEKMFDINDQINMQKMAESDAESQISKGQGESAFGGALMKGIPDLMKLATLF